MKSQSLWLLGGVGVLGYLFLKQQQANALTPQQQMQMQQQQAANQQNQSLISQGGNLLSSLFGGGFGAGHTGGAHSGGASYNNTFVPGTGGYYNDNGGYIFTGAGGSTYTSPANVAYANAMQTVMQAGNPYG